MPPAAHFHQAGTKSPQTPRPGMGAAALVLQGREQGRLFSLVTFFVNTKLRAKQSFALRPYTKSNRFCALTGLTR